MTDCNLMDKRKQTNQCNQNYRQEPKKVDHEQLANCPNDNLTPAVAKLELLTKHCNHTS